MRVCAALCLTAICLITLVTSQVGGAPNNVTKPTKPPKTTVTRTTRVPTTKIPKPVPTRKAVVTTAVPPTLTTRDDEYVTSGTTKIWRISRTNRTETTTVAIKPTRPGITPTTSSVPRVTTAISTSIASTRPLPVITTSGSAYGINWTTALQTERYPMISTEHPSHHNRHHNQHHTVRHISTEVTTAKPTPQTVVVSTPKDQRTLVKSMEVDGSHHKDSHQKDHGKSHHSPTTTSRSNPVKAAASVKSAAGPSTTSGIGSSSAVLRRLQTLTGAAAALALSVFVMQRY